MYSKVIFLNQYPKITSINMIKEKKLKNYKMKFLNTLKNYS